MEHFYEIFSLYLLATIFILFIIYTGHMLFLWTIKELSFNDSFMKSSEFLIGVIAMSLLFIALGVMGIILVFAMYFIYYWGKKKMDNKDAAYQSMIISLKTLFLGVLFVPYLAGVIVGFISY